MKEIYGKDYFYGRKNSNYSNYDKINHSKLFKSVVSFIKSQKINGRILDVGCAFGYLLREISPFCKEIYGCDISEFAIEKAKEIVPQADLRVADTEQSLPYLDDSFDCITALDTLEHMMDFEKSLAEIVKKLKKGGYLIIRVPIDAWHRKLFGCFDIDKTHISILKEKEIIRIIENNKLKIVTKKRFCLSLLDYKIPYIPSAIEIVCKKM